ncbi:MAG TPA: DUF2971 domain-containing protein [Polyangiaceae bacterium]|nr:DUF2971 domain-containing protein [Polyangiaceae bacterium]
MFTYYSEPHDVFDLPDDATDLWRYQTLPKILSLLDTRRLFFCRASKFEDRFEGAMPKRMDARVREYAARRMTPEADANYHRHRIETRERMAISCWHMSSHESAAMWSLYGLNGEGVAIKSSVWRLVAALPQHDTASGRQQSHRIFVGAVKYIDYSTADFPRVNLFYPYVHKRESFKHESELRAVTHISPAAEDAFDGGGVDFEITAGGLAIPVDVEKLIEAVYISPLGSPSFERVVRATLDRFGYGTIPVVKSPMAEDPIY